MRLKNNRFAVFNIIIISIYLVLLTTLILCMCLIPPAIQLKTKTGTVSKYTNNKADDFLSFIAVAYPHFNVQFTDGSSYTASGSYYDNIDKTLFSELSVGDTLTVIYAEADVGSTHSIYGIKYNNKTYLSSDINKDSANNRKITVIVCPILIAVISLATVGLVFLNYKKYKAKNNKFNEQLERLF